jgi:hypothetical protein
VSLFTEFAKTSNLADTPDYKQYLTELASFKKRALSTEVMEDALELVKQDPKNSKVAVQALTKDP